MNIKDLPSDSYTVEKPGMMNINSMNSGSYSIDNSSAGLAHSQGVFDSIGSAAKAYSETMGKISQGVAKEDISTLAGAGTMVSKIGSHLPGEVGQFFRGGVQEGKNTMASMEARGAAEKTGQLATQAAEFFVPGGAEKSVLEKGASYINKLPEVLGLAGRSASALVGGLKTALKSLVSGASMGAVTAAQTGGDPSAVKLSAEAGGAAGSFSGLVDAFGPAISNSLNKADFRLTPTKEEKTQKIADSAAKFMTENKILGTNPTKYRKLLMINRNLESALQSSLPKEFQVAKSDIETHINDFVEKLKSDDPAVYKQAQAKGQEAIDTLKSSPGTNISVKDVLSGKRSWGQMAFKMSSKGKIDPTVSNEGAYAAELAYQKSLERAMEKSNASIKIPTTLQKYFNGSSEVTLPEFNKVYSAAINAKNLTGIAQYRNDAGLFGRMFGLWVGKTIGQSVMPGLLGEIVGAGGGEIAAQKLAGGTRNISERLLSSPELPVRGTKIIRGLQDRGQNQDQLQYPNP